jgi:hypothetical protein
LVYAISQEKIGFFIPRWLKRLQLIQKLFEIGEICCSQSVARVFYVAGDINLMFVFAFKICNDDALLSSLVITASAESI